MTALTMDRLAPVSLDELNATSALLTRIDRKYVLDDDAAASLLALLPSDTRQLEIGSRRCFGYHSLYFDTPSLESFRGTAHRRRRRYKVRIRSYDTGLRFLEVKTRRGAHTVKERIGCDHMILTQEGAYYVEDRLDAARITPDGPLDPVLITEYRRRTFLLSDGARLTVDTDLSWHSVGRQLHVPGLVIVETKSGARPSQADRLLWADGHRPEPISKYATGLAALRPHLPQNRWHRLLASTLSGGDAAA
ncbi:MAG TPA: VTC domain-containing protein [Arachnia sp.]|nr:VTC domain-containing protein [Arachnia sp.]HMT86407.1 VTC domain-containing protein [Arachnia sp.]